MPQDHLGNELSVSAELTETGVKAGAKSRALASFDRMVGAVVDIGNAHLEGYADRKRAKTRGEVAVIDAAVQYGVERLGASPEQAERAFQKHFSKVLKQQQNLEAVVEEAKVDLIEGQQDYEDVQGPMAEEFFDRFEAYSMNASTDDLRQRWGRVLASEIRRPGTFSAKVLRVVDEMGAETARLFERFCGYRAGGAVFKALLGELSFEEQARLVTAGLIVDPGLTGQMWGMPKVKLNDEDYYLGGSKLKFAIPADEAEKNSGMDHLITTAKGEDRGIPVYVLTDEAVAIASILPDNSHQVVVEYAKKLAEHVKDNRIMLLSPTGDGYLTQFGFAVAEPR